jgi:hypothetical protein
MVGFDFFRRKEHDQHEHEIVDDGNPHQIRIKEIVVVFIEKKEIDQVRQQTENG